MSLPTPAPARPCPFCGRGLLPAAHNTGYYHEVSDCFMTGYHIGAACVAAWNRRSPAMWYEDGGDRPHFNEEGRGQPVTAAKVNDMLHWLADALAAAKGIG